MSPSAKRTEEQQAALRARQQANLQAQQAQQAHNPQRTRQAPQTRDPKTGKQQSRYPTFTRTALAPGLLAAICLLAAVAVIGSSWFTILQYAIAILALIVCVFAWQAKQWWWIIGLVPIAVVWNPVLPLSFDAPVWYVLHLAAAVVFVAAGLFIKIPVSNAK